MADPYPKSYDELLAENAQLRQRVAGLEAFSKSQEQQLLAKGQEVDHLRSRKPVRVLDPKAVDAFLRPYRG